MKALGFLTALSFALWQAPMTAAQDSSSVDASDNGNIAFQIKIPEKGCRSLYLALKDSNGNLVRPKRINFKKKQAKRGRFTDVLRFSVPEGQYHLDNINCASKERFMGVNYKPGKLTKNFPTEATEGPIRFNVNSGRDTYLGALDFHKFGAAGHAVITLDKSAEAVKDRQLTEGGFDKSFLITSFDYAPVKAKYMERLESRGDVEGQVKKIHDAVDSEKPPTNGKGRIAMHVKSDFDCNYINIRFVPSDLKKKTGVKKLLSNQGLNNQRVFGPGVPKGDARVLRFDQDKEGQFSDFTTVKVKSGRYKMLDIVCGQEGNKFLQSQSLIRAEVDVYPEDIAYVGELYFKKTVDNTAKLEAKRNKLRADMPSLDESGIETMLSASRIPPYEFAMIMGDRFDEAKTHVKKPEQLKRRKLDSTNFRKKEVASRQLVSQKVINLRINELTRYEEALASYDANLIVRP